MSYQVLARKWRPKLFEALVGQEHVVRALTNALEQQRLHHAYLFTGTRGVGKTTLARILAKSLNCETGITAHPCGVCSACIDIDRGRFVDMIEVDAASNTQVDNMRDLLDNAQYAPTVGRFKVYIIDEVHMLTRNSFNAMLKTLEEPPAHVKFILATTDPQKMPVTVLSRCLQFNLRQMSGTAIVDHLQNVLKEENIAFEAPALQLLARVANGSMRDALSLLDQAIAYGGNSVQEEAVRGMLGAIDQSYLYELLHALAAQDSNRLIAQAKAMEQRSLSFDAALNDLAALLQQIAVAQAVPDTVPLDMPERHALLDLAKALSAEQVQLYYQIALLGRRDIGLAPDEYAGFTMSLLRMLAFTPMQSLQGSSGNSTPTPPVRRSNNTASAVLDTAPQQPLAETSAVPANLSATTQPAPLPAEPDDEINATIATEPGGQALTFDGNWRRLVDELKLGLARALAQNCELVSFDDNEIVLSVPQEHRHLLDPSYQEKLKAAIQQHFGRKIQLSISVGGTGNTPAQQISQEKAVLQSRAEESIQQDDFVQALVKDFGAHIIPTSIKPIQ
jgi:DNA polymerase-3 subunit gamma/tau